MNWLDLVLILAIGYSTFSGYRNGFIRELVSIAAVILAIPLAGIFYDDMFPKVEPIVRNEDLAALFSFVAIMAGVIIGGQVAAHLLKRTAEILNLGILDRLAGRVRVPEGCLHRAGFAGRARDLSTPGYAKDRRWFDDRHATDRHRTDGPDLPSTHIR